MKPKLKNSLVIVITLLIGFALGILVSGRYTKARIDRLKNFYTEQGFNREFIRVLEPSPEQREELRPILRKYSELNRELLSTHKEEQVELFKNLKSEMWPYLTEAQKERLERFKMQREKRLKRRNHMDKKRERRRGPDQ